MKWKSENYIEKIYIYNASICTRELPQALLSAIRLVHDKPWNIEIVHEIDPTKDNILYIIICPAGLNRAIKMPKYYINYQLEYILGRYDSDNYNEKLRGAIANWDYSKFNMEILKVRDNIDSVYVPPGFNESISTEDILNGNYLYNDDDKEYDILFLGYCEIYPRRTKVRKEFYKSGRKCLFIVDKDLNEMKTLIRKSKICINMASTDTFILAKIRLNILLSNQACIVSEESIDDDADKLYKKSGMLIVPFSKLVSESLNLLDNFEKRREMAIKGYQWYKTQRNWNDIVDFKSLLPET
jgi:hypothetical protein